ncbi:MAG: ABC transporter permease [Propionibacteriaceae bacterium]|nr:ABC transporter permease [Propionibacteriaceae bacterium]
MLAAVDLGLIYALMAMGVYLTFRVLDFADLTVDGSLVTGAAVTAVGVVAGWPPALCTLLGFVCGCAAGAITGLLNTVGKINPLLAGILTQIALYSINLRIMGKANLGLLRSTTVLSGLRDAGLFATWASVGVFLTGVGVIAFGLIWFLTTNIGLGMQATGDNAAMARAQGVHTSGMVILGLAMSNGLVGLSGALLSQYQGFADISMGIGTIVVGLASVIVGQAIFGSRPVWRAVVAVIAGSIIYRVVIQLALGLNIGLLASDMKIISAVLVVAALLLPKLAIFQRFAHSRQERLLAQQVLADDIAAAQATSTLTVDRTSPPSDPPGLTEGVDAHTPPVTGGRA